MATGTRRSLGVAALALFALGLGCTDTPVAPQSSEPTSPHFVQVQKSGGILPAPMPGENEPLRGDLSIDGAIGGELTVGRFTVVVPAGAFDGSATVSLSVPDPDVMICDLEIAPLSKNAFLEPVTLKAKCSDVVDAKDWYDLHILWHDKVNERWAPPAETTRNSSSGTVETELDHFSEYGVVMGRTGW